MLLGSSRLGFVTCGLSFCHIVSQAAEFGVIAHTLAKHPTKELRWLSDAADLISLHEMLQAAICGISKVGSMLEALLVELPEEMVLTVQGLPREGAAQKAFVHQHLRPHNGIIVTCAGAFVSTSN